MWVCKGGGSGVGAGAGRGGAWLGGVWVEVGSGRGGLRWGKCGMLGGAWGRDLEMEGWVKA